MTSRRVAPIVLCGLLALARSGAAQQPRARPAPVRGVGFVRGIVYDSLLGAPLAGARVSVRGTSRSATADAGGRFRLDSVPAGNQVIAFTHPGLDSAGLSNLAARVDVRPGVLTVAELGVPSLRTLRRGVCGSETAPGRDSGLVLGSVSDAETGERLTGAGVAVAWVAVRRTPEGRIDVYRPGVDAVTDSTGTYYACNVATEIVVTAQTAAGPFFSGLTELIVGPRPVARQDLTVSREDVPGARDSTGRRAGLATIIGVVRDEHGLSRPSATVSVDDAAGMVYSDSGGRFALENLPSGSQMLMARMVGFSAARRMVQLRNRDTLRVELVLRRVTILDTLRVTASRMARSELDDLERRMRTGSAYFLTGDQVKQRTSMRSVFQGLPSLIIEGRSVYNFQMYTLNSGRPCAVSIFVDGQRADVQSVQSYRPDQLVAVEYYPRGQDGPIRFQSMGSANCGLLLLWTTFLR